jgi:hypothetical protein
MRRVPVLAVLLTAFVLQAQERSAASPAASTVSHLRTSVVAVTKGSPQAAEFFTVKVTVLNLGPDALVDGKLYVSMNHEVADIEAIAVRSAGHCTLGKPTIQYDRAVCPLNRLGIGGAAVVTVRIEVPRALERRRLVFIGSVIGPGVSSKTSTVGHYIATVRPAAASAVVSWTGTWSTDFGTMLLQQSGNHVTGSYTHDQGRLDGTLSSTGRVFTGTWNEAPTRTGPVDAGAFEFQLSPGDRSFSGLWNYAKDAAGAWRGTWRGTRQ